MSPEPEKIVPRRKAPTPEQLARREEVDRRNALLQVKGVPHPKSGTFGLPPKGKGEK